MPNIFVVDDEPVIASSLAATLKLQGYATSFFTSPLEALASARANVPDLLISNVAMPGISGIELAIEMSSRYPECKILLFSGQDLLGDARNSGFTMLTNLFNRPQGFFRSLRSARRGRLLRLKGSKHRSPITYLDGMVLAVSMKMQRLAWKPVLQH